MSYYDQEFYHEPSEFDIQMEEFKTNIMKSVKEEFVAKMERLEKENKELQEVKSNFEQIKKDYQQKEYQLNVDRKNMESKVRRERLSSLMKDFEIVMYRAYSKRELPPKCEKCDNQRRIKYFTPLGKEAHEKCSCSVGEVVYYPEEYICSEFKVNYNGNGMNAWYKMNHDPDGDFATLSSSVFAKLVYHDSVKYEDINKYDTFFKTKEECQGFCDYLNAETQS